MKLYYIRYFGLKKTKIIFPLLFIVLLLACKSEVKNGDRYVNVEQTNSSKSKTLTKGDSIILKTIAAHGGERYNTAAYSFVFRKGSYSFENNGPSFKYTGIKEKHGDTILDILENGKLERMVNGQPQPLTEEDASKYAQTLNSVIYFATLPHKLKDNAVNKEYKGTAVIKDSLYEVIAVTFDQEGGGNDFDDTYYYWINSETNTMDYLAYNFHINEGGVRFRKAYNRRVVAGITFQDYINYEAPVGTPLRELPAGYEAGKLEELSRIKTENITTISNLNN